MNVSTLRTALNEAVPNKPQRTDEAVLLRDLLEIADALRAGIDALAERVTQRLGEVEGARPNDAPSPAKPRRISLRAVPNAPSATPKPKPAVARPQKPEKLSNELKGRGPQAILDALAWWQMAGIEEPTRHQVAFIANYTVNGHFNNLLRSLRTYGYIDYAAGQRLVLTSTGQRYADYPATPPTRAALHAQVRTKLDGPQQRLFDALLDGRLDVIEVLSNEELAGRAGYTVNGHYGNQRGALKKLGVIEYERGGSRLAGWLFPANLD